MSIVDDVTAISEVRDTPGANGQPSVTNCQRPGCELTLPTEGEPGYHRMRKYCDDHQPKATQKAKRADRQPRSVHVDLRPPKATKNTELERLEQGALRLLGFLPLAMALANDEVCGDALTNALPAIAKQLALVAEYHPALAKILAPTSEATGEAMAWFGLFMATSPVLLAVLVHHHVLPAKITATLENTLRTVSDIGQ